MLELKITSARMAGGQDESWLSVRVAPEGLPALRRWLFENPKGEWRLSLRRWHKKRSLDANGYAWALLDRLAASVGLPKEEVYRQEIRRVGGVSEVIAIREEAVETFKRSWETGHIGQFVEDMGPHATAAGYRTLVCYYGSSGYDTAQMSRLIDCIVQDCRALGIETATDRELSLLLEGWDGAKKGKNDV